MQPIGRFTTAAGQTKHWADPSSTTICSIPTAIVRKIVGRPTHTDERWYTILRMVQMSLNIPKIGA